MARGAVSGFLSGVAVSAVAALGLTFAVGLPERLRAPIPLQDPPDTATADVTAPGTSEVAALETPTPDAPTGIIAPPAPLTATDAGRATAPVPPAPLPQAPAPVTTTEAPGAVQVGQGAQVPSVTFGTPVPQAPQPVLAVPQTDAIPVRRGGTPTVSVQTVPASPAAQTPEEPAAQVSTGGDSLGQVAAPQTVAVVQAPDQPARVLRPTLRSEVTVAELPATRPVVRQIVQITPDEGTDTALTDPMTEETETATTAPAPRIGRPANSLLQREDAVPVRRVVATDPTPATPAQDLAQRPLAQFAKPVTLTPDAPLLSVVLIHDDKSPFGPEAFRAFAVPVTIAVDAGLPNAQDLVTAYRAEGLEVMALVRLPEQTSAFDAELAVQSVLNTLPEVIGVLEAPDASLQGALPVTEQIADLLARTGHGALFQSEGLNPALALASEAGVAADLIGRDIDIGGKDGRVIRRFLDQGAFRARQEGSTVLMGRVRAETISSLLLWGLQRRADGVELAPASAVLLRKAGSGAPG